MLKRKNKIENNKGSKSQLIIVGSLLIILGTLIIGGKYLYNYLETKNEEQLIDTFFEEQKKLQKILLQKCQKKKWKLKSHNLLKRK